MTVKKLADELGVDPELVESAVAEIVERRERSALRRAASKTQRPEP